MFAYGRATAQISRDGGEKMIPKCRICGVELTDENWVPSRKKENSRICKACESAHKKKYAKANPEKIKAKYMRTRIRKGIRPMNENTKCSSFLGIYIAEQVLAKVFKNVEQMPMNNPGFDFICGRGYKIDVKSACQRKCKRWEFHIRHNTVAEYFLCLAFNNREDLTPLHVWMLPSDKFNHLGTATISLSTIHKWDDYQLDVTKVAMCCNAMRTNIAESTFCHILP